MDQADSVHSTPRKTAFQIVAENDFVAQLPDANALEEPAQRKEDPRTAAPKRVSGRIACHRSGRRGRCDLPPHRRPPSGGCPLRPLRGCQEAEGKVSDDEYSYLQRNTSIAWDQMMMFSRCVILCRPTTRRGLIHQVRYLVSQFNDLVGCQQGCMYLPDNIGEQPWPMAFLQSLAAGLRKMAGELDPANEGGAA
jgi:hypothetical protein